MSATTTAKDLLESVPGWTRRNASITELTGGLNNRSFRVESGNRSYVLRIVDDPDQADVRNHELELKIQQLAAGQGLAPQVVFADPASGLMLAEFLPGRNWTPRDLHDRGNLRKLAGLLRRLHRLPRCGVAFDAQGAADGYLATLERHGRMSSFAADCRRIIADTPDSGEFRCCHNDVVAENLIDGETLKLIDFEYASDNDPCFDIASVIGWHNLSGREAQYLLEACATSRLSEWRERLELQQRLFDALQWLWLAAREALQPVPAQANQMQRVAGRLS